MLAWLSLPKSNYLRLNSTRSSSLDLVTSEMMKGASTSVLLG